MFDADARLLITGAGGWLGREALVRVKMIRPNVQILAFANTSRRLEFHDLDVQLHSWDSSLIERWQPTVVLDLAFITREHLRTMSPLQYRSKNLELIRRSLWLSSLHSVKGYVYLSSGAVMDKQPDLYADLKLQAETAVQEVARDRVLPLVVARAWSLSGGLCTKPKTFALFDLIRQTMHEPTVTIYAQNEVWRRYTDAGDFLEVALRGLECGQQLVVDSTGPLVEIGELALEVQEVLGVTKPIHRSLTRDTPNSYFTDSTVMDELADRLAIDIKSLHDQIRISAGVIKRP